MIKRSPKIGEVYIMKFGGTDSEQAGIRPGLIIQNNVGNVCSPNVIALPLTSNLKKTSLPTHVILRSEDTGLLRDSVVLCEGPERMAKSRIGNYITTLGSEDMARIARAHLLSTSIMSFLGVEEIKDIWYNSIKLNG